jgi:hypothetical protein
MENKPIKDAKGLWVKGQSANPKGKPKGVVHKKTEQWNALIESLKDEHTQRFNQVLGKLDDRDFIRVYLEILNYWKPKLSAATNMNLNASENSLSLVINASDIPSFPSNVDEEGFTDAEEVP